MFSDHDETSPSIYCTIYQGSSVKEHQSECCDGAEPS